MELNQPVEDIDRTSINGKAAGIFLNRICVKDIGKCDIINSYVTCLLRNDSMHQAASGLHQSVSCTVKLIRYLQWTKIYFNA